MSRIAVLMSVATLLAATAREGTMRLRHPLVVSFVLIVCITTLVNAGSTSAAARAATGRGYLLTSTEVGTSPESLATADGSIWVADDFGVERVAPSGELEAAFSLGPVADVAAAGSNVWISSYGNNVVGRIDPQANRVVLEERIDRPTALAVYARALWVASVPTGTVWRLNPDDGTIIDDIVLDPDPAPAFVVPPVPPVPEIAAGMGGVWVAYESDLVRIDPATDEVVARIRIPGGAASIAIGKSSVWAASTSKPVLVRIDPETNATRRIRLPVQTFAVSATAKGVWIAGTETQLLHLDVSTLRVDRRLEMPGVVDKVVSLGPLLFGGLHHYPEALWYHPADRLLAIDPSPTLASPGTPVVVRPMTVSLPVGTTQNVPFTPPMRCGPPGHRFPCRPRLDVLTPFGAHDAPVIVMARGGPGPVGSRRCCSRMMSGMVSRGAVVFNIDYSDYGTHPQIIGDISCAVAYARARAARYGGDPSRITLVGRSWGSYLGGRVALAGQVRKDRCLVDGSGLPDAYVGIAGHPDIKTTLLGRNPRVEIRLIIGALDDPREIRKARYWGRVLMNAGYDATFTLVPQADHTTVGDPSTSIPTDGIVLAAARGSS